LFGLEIKRTTKRSNNRTKKHKKQERHHEESSTLEITQQPQERIMADNVEPKRRFKDYAQNLRPKQLSKHSHTNRSNRNEAMFAVFDHIKLVLRFGQQGSLQPLIHLL